MNKIGDGGWRDGNGYNRPMFSDLYEMNDQSTSVSMLKMETIVPLHHMKVLHHFGLEPTIRFLVHGPRDCGKPCWPRAIVNEAGVHSYEICAAELMSGVSEVLEFSDDLESLSVTMKDFWAACSIVKSSSDMECFLITPNAKWDDVVGLQSLKSKFERHIVKRIKFPEFNKVMILNTIYSLGVQQLNAFRHAHL